MNLLVLVLEGLIVEPDGDPISVVYNPVVRYGVPPLFSKVNVDETAIHLQICFTCPMREVSSNSMPCMNSRVTSNYFHTA